MRIRQLRDRERRLLVLLRTCEERGARFRPDAVAAEIGYKPATVKTYASKKLDGWLLTREHDGAYRVRGAIVCTDEEFATRMSQKETDSDSGGPTNEDEWRDNVRSLLHVGLNRGYTLDDELGDLVLDLAE
ncbi:MAG: hypothetical protein EXR79_17660 [Myxococcales bacterium]|nr:hypothetical protein [Myxococcales bacterium]